MMTKRLFVLSSLSVIGLFSSVRGQRLPMQHGTGVAPAHYEASPSPEFKAGGGDMTPMPLMPPGNDACASATTLTMGASCITGTTNGGSTQGGEYLCISPGGGISPETSWYRFTASNDSLVLGMVITNYTNCATVLAVYGPFAPGGGCLPGAGSQVLCQNMGLIDPGFHPLLTGLTIGQDYLVQVQGNNCGGGNDRFVNYCISIANPASNVRATTSNVISSCGVAFNGTTAGGYWNNGTSIGSNNLDGNAATSVAGASEVGDDVTFVINNCSWFSFCNGNASSCNWSLTVNGISGCLLPVPNDGVQAAVFTGTPAALTNIASSPSRVPAGGSWSSGTFSLAAGGCAYIMVDGFAGDQCNYTLTLTNVSCPCLILPVELAWFSARDFGRFVQLDWQMASEDGIVEYWMESSEDGLKYTRFASVPGGAREFMLQDRNAFHGWRYYRLIAVDQDGLQQVLGVTSVNRSSVATPLVVHEVGGKLEVRFKSSLKGNAQIDIVDVSGKVVGSTTITAEIGENLVELDIAQLESGVYFVRASNGQSMQTAKFLKR